MGAIVGGAIAAGGAILGDVISAQGQSGANAMNMAIAQDQMAFQKQSQLQAESYDTEMSDTAMQRRVADLKAAGLNPLLAVGQGGASAPVVSGQSGASIAMQNPESAFGNMGTQMGSAVQVASQVQQQQAQTALTEAQTKKTISETPTKEARVSPGIDPDSGAPIDIVGPGGHELGDANVDNIRASTGLLGVQTNQAKANIDLIGAQVKNTGANMDLTQIQSMLAGQNLDVLRATKQYLIQQQAALGAQASNQTDLYRSRLGQALNVVNAILQPVTSAVGAVKGSAVMPSVGYGGKVQ